MRMIKSSDLKPDFQNLFDDFNHPNPNINAKAYWDMVKYWPNESIQKLLTLIGDEDLIVRRKSVLAFAAFGELAISPIANLYFSNKNPIVRLSCLKIFVKLAASKQLEPTSLGVNKVIESAIKDDSPEVILTVVSLLRQIGINYLIVLFECCKSKNVLRAKAAISAVIEIDHPSGRKFMKELLHNDEIDLLLREDIQNYLKTFNDNNIKPKY